MDRLTWIHADAQLRELRVLNDITGADMQIDISTGAQLIDNTWSMTLPEDVWIQAPILEGHYIYAPGTEWGGPVTLIRHNTAEQSVTLQGPTWRGLLHQKRIYPPAGEGYLEITADANSMIAQVIGSVFGALFAVDSASAGVTVTAQFRYQSMAAGLENTLRKYGLRLQVVFDNSVPAVILSAEPVNDLEQTVEISQDYGVDFTSQIGNVELANHCLALGSGELAERMVLNVYRVGATCYLTRPESLPESAVRTVLLDYPNAETEDDLLQSAIDTLQECAPAQSIDVDQLKIDVYADLGDRIPVRDRVTGLTATSEIITKILTIQNGAIAISMKVGLLTIEEAT